MDLNQQNPKKKQNVYTNDSVLESLRDISSGVGKTVARDVAGKVAGDTFASLFGSMPKAPKPGDFPFPRPDSRPERFGQFPFRRPEIKPRPPMVKMEEIGVAQKIEAVRNELKALVVSIKSLHVEIEKAVSEVPVHPGVYHVNFLERLKSVIISLRQHIDDSRSWLSLSTNRKKKKGFWGMYKKHGTSFGLSSERNVSTQAG